MNRNYLLKQQFKTAKNARIIAKLIDLFIVLAMSSLIYPVGVLFGCIYMSLSDCLNQGQSVGKKIIGFSVISLIDGKPCTKKQSFIRNLPIVIPLFFMIIPLWGWILAGILALPLFLLEVYFIYKIESTKRLGDVMADTTVIPNDYQRVDIRKTQASWYHSKPT